MFLNAITGKLVIELAILKKLVKKSIRVHKRAKFNQEIDTEEEEDREESLITFPKQESILNWCVRPMSNIQFEKLHTKLLYAMIYGNIPFNFAQNPYFRNYLHDLSPTYQPPMLQFV